MADRAVICRYTLRRSAAPEQIFFAYISLILCLLLLSACSQDTETPFWLLGRWQVVFNPNHQDKDDLIFHQNGKVSIETEEGTTLHGYFLIKNNALILFIQTENKNIEIHIKTTESNDQLIFTSGAFYKKKNNS